MDRLEQKSRRRTELEESQAQEEQYHLSGEFRHGNELSEAELEELRTAISEFHTELGFDSAASNDTATMLTRIENTMEELTQLLVQIDKKVLTDKAMELEEERREEERTQKNARAKRDQEEKTQKAIQNAMMPIKRKTGRPLVARMVPQKQESREKREEIMRQRLAQEAADENLLFGEIWD
jgi:hypothetical protein